MRERNGTTAMVIGAGIAGLVTARVLSEHVDRVTVLERDRLPQDAVTRRSVPQGRHAHVLLAAGQHLLAGWFPGLVDELVQAGAVPLDAKDLVWHQAGAHRVRSDLGFLTMSMSRPLLECTVRERLLRQRSNVSVTDETAVDRLVLEGGRVVGVRTDGTEHRSDLVVDCTGRNTRFLDQLARAGFPAPEVSAIRIDTAYGTRTVRRRPDDLDGTLALVVDDPARGHRMGMMVPVEGGRWIVTVGSLHGDVPPTEPAEYEDFALSLPSPEIADVLARAEALTPVLSHRMPTSRRRHVERLERTPPGFLVLGDAICSLNPFTGRECRRLPCRRGPWAGPSNATALPPPHWRVISTGGPQKWWTYRGGSRQGPTSPTLAPAGPSRLAPASSTATSTRCSGPATPPSRWPARRCGCRTCWPGRSHS